MQSDQSQSINPLRLAKTRERIDGEIELSTLKRLNGLLLDTQGKLKYSFEFDYDQSGLCVVESNIDTVLILECQRCFKALDVDIHKSSLLAVVNNKEEFEALADEYEPLQLKNDNTTVEQLVEDELLLSIPLSVLHAEDTCQGMDELERINDEARLQPFAGLADLMKEKN